MLEKFKSKNDLAQSSGDIEEVASEIKVLHGLVEQLYSSGKPDARPVTIDTLDVDPITEKVNSPALVPEILMKLAESFS